MSESLISTLGVGSSRKGPKEGLTALVHIDDSMKALMSQAQPDSIDAKEELSAEMTKLMIEKINDFKMTTNRIKSVLKDDISTDYNVLDLAYKYLKMSDHKGPGMSKKMRRNLLKKVDSLEQLAKRLNGGQDPISTDVKKGTDMYDLRTHFKGTRGSVEMEAKLKAKREAKKRKEIMERRKSGVKKVSAIDRLSKSKNKLSFKSAASKFRNKQTLEQMVKLAKIRQEKIDEKEKSIKELARKRAGHARDARKKLQALADRYSTRSVATGHEEFYTGSGGPPFSLDSRSTLIYTAHIINLQEGTYAEAILQKYLPSKSSVKVFEQCYWATHCKYFQRNSGDVLHKITDSLAALYVQLMDAIPKETHKAIFFKYHIYVIAYAVAIAFYYHCPGSRNMYDTAQTTFKLDTFQYISSLLTGMDLLPESANLMSSTLFGEVLINKKKSKNNDDDDNVKKKKDNSNTKIMSMFNNNKSKTKAKGPQASLLFSGQALWIPAGNLQKSASSAANAGVSPLVEQFLIGKSYKTSKKMKKSTTSHGHTSPLSLKRSGPPRKLYRLPTAAGRVTEMREIMKDLKAKYKYKVRSCNSDIRASRKELKQSMSTIDLEQRRLRTAGVEERQRFTFTITEAKKGSKRRF
jgi:hypothetical protein